MLPQDVIFTCHDNIIAPIGPNVSTAWGQLPPERERWAMPWVECDLNDCWVRQPNVETLGVLAPDALYQRQREEFSYLGNPMRVWEAIRYGDFARIALEVVREEAPQLRMVLVGWGGDRWMLFAD